MQQTRISLSQVQYMYLLCPNSQNLVPSRREISCTDESSSGSWWAGLPMLASGQDRMLSMTRWYLLRHPSAEHLHELVLMDRLPGCFHKEIRSTSSHCSLPGHIITVIGMRFRTCQGLSWQQP